MQHAMAALTNTSARAADPLADCMANLGGATLELGGGEFLIAAPLVSGGTPCLAPSEDVPRPAFVRATARPFAR